MTLSSIRGPAIRPTRWPAVEQDRSITGIMVGTRDEISINGVSVARRRRKDRPWATAHFDGGRPAPVR